MYVLRTVSNVEVQHKNVRICNLMYGMVRLVALLLTETGWFVFVALRIVLNEYETSPKQARVGKFSND